MKKGWQIALFITLILVADQVLKVYIKTHYYLGEEHLVLGHFFRLHFVENPGMAWGWKFGGDWGKLILTLFRLVAVILGIFYLRSIIQKKYHPGFITCAALVFAGAAGNLIDSLFYGMIFNNSDFFLHNVAVMFPKGGGYAGFLHGQVVDMLYFPLIDSHFPSWLPIWGGQDFEFFSPVFNLADASISVGVIAILLWQGRFFPKKQIETINSTGVVSTTPIINENI